MIISCRASLQSSIISRAAGVRLGKCLFKTQEGTMSFI